MALSWTSPVFRISWRGGGDGHKYEARGEGSKGVRDRTSRSPAERNPAEIPGAVRIQLLNDGRIPIRIFLQVRHPLGHPLGCRRILQIVIEELEKADRQILAIR